MIEAVNSVISSAPMLRQSAEQVDAARSFAANPERLQELPRAPYISPFVHVDLTFDTAVLQIRDSDTGDVVNQFPSESTLKASQRAKLAQQAQVSQAAEEATEKLTVGPGQSDGSEQVAESGTGSPELSSNPVAVQAVAAFEAGAQSAQVGSEQISMLA